MYVRLSEEATYHKPIVPPIQWEDLLRRLIQKVNLKGWSKSWKVDLEG